MIFERVGDLIAGSGLLISATNYSAQYHRGPFLEGIRDGVPRAVPACLPLVPGSHQLKPDRLIE